MSERYFLPYIDYSVELTRDDYWMLRRYVGEQDYNGRGCVGMRAPDQIIDPFGKPYLFRWHLVPKNDAGNVFIHVQVASDTDRHLHDHHADNTTVILSGGYEEIYQDPAVHDMLCESDFEIRRLRKGDVVYRKAELAHRLVLPTEVPYSISLFTTGPERRQWGFWTPQGWRPSPEVIKERNF